LEFVDTRTSLETLISQALAQRPEIAARATDVAVQQTRLRQEKIRPLLPTLYMGFSAGDFGGGSDQVGYRFSHFNSRTDFDVLAVWTLRNLGFGNRALQNKVHAEIGQADAARALTIDTVRREVAEALAQATSQRRLMEIAQKRVVTAQSAFRQGRPIEVLDSLNLLTAARQDLVAAMAGYSQAQISLFVAIGNAPFSPFSGQPKAYLGTPTVER
jgi:outer membrane protein TolC